MEIHVILGYSDVDFIPSFEVYLKTNWQFLLLMVFWYFFDIL